MKLIQPFLASLLLLGLVFACQPLEDIDKVEAAAFDAEYAVPIASAQLSLRDVLESFEDLNTVFVDEEGLIHFRYQGDLISQNSEAVFDGINATLNNTPIPVLDKKMPIILGDDTGLEFDHLIFKGGKLNMVAQNRHADEVTFTITLPQITKNGEPLTDTFDMMPFDGEGFPTPYLKQYDLEGYEAIPDPVTDSLYIEYELIRSNGEPDTADFVLMTFEDLSFSYMEGYMGIESHKGNDTIIIDFFDNYVKGDIYFADPTVTFYVENAFGIPTRSQVNIFEVFTVRDEVLNLEGEYITNGIDFPYPALDKVGEREYGEFVFDKNNSNIDDILGAGPIAIHYDVDAITNPDSNTMIRGFLTDSSFYKVRVEVDLPLYGTSIDFIARDTFDLSFDNFGDVKNAEFKLVAENELPLDVFIQGYMLNEQGVVIDSLFTDNQLVVASASVDELGYVEASTERVSFIDFPEERFEKVKDTRSLEIVASFYTANEGKQAVYILESQNLNVRIGAKLGVSR
jgi:hypothetical protein